LDSTLVVATKFDETWVSTFKINIKWNNHVVNMTVILELPQEVVFLMIGNLAVWLDSDETIIIWSVLSTRYSIDQQKSLSYGSLPIILLVFEDKIILVDLAWERNFLEVPRPSVVIINLFWVVVSSGNLLFSSTFVNIELLAHTAGWTIAFSRDQADTRFMSGDP
jgi:hypothetical protein